MTEREALIAVVADIRRVAAPLRQFDHDRANVIDGWGDRIEDVADRLAALRAKSGPQWQDIASAPKDADVLLLFLDGSGVQPGYWDGDGWVAVETFGLTGGSWHDTPTHWMPLPAPPEPRP